MRDALASAARFGLYEATARGLQSKRKQLPTVWLYDERGSQLYEEITRLPEYYLPQHEREILRTWAPAIAARTQARTLVELGAGSAANTRVLLDALHTLERFVPLDVSEEALRASAEGIAAAYPRILVDPVLGDFERDLESLPGDGRTLIAFLGSTIGNLYPRHRHRFLETLAGVLDDDDALLVGVDLVKDAARIEAAYNDPGGATEAFVRNALSTVNRELEATFDQRYFTYDAHWDRKKEWMDIGLRARQRHTVSIGRLELDVPFEEGEPLRVEISAKFRHAQFEDELGSAGLRIESWWTDGAGDFALALAFSRAA
jgi:L-histidine N-alpha-methyltransferase